MRGAEFSTDHILIRSKIRLHLRTQNSRTAPRPKPGLDVGKLHSPEVLTELNSATGVSIAKLTPCLESVDTHWSQLADAILEPAQRILGSRQRKNRDWFNENDANIEALPSTKRASLLAYRASGSNSDRQHYNRSSAIAQKELRRMHYNWWNQIAADIQAFADRGDQGGLFQALKRAFGLTSSAAAPLLSADGLMLLSDRISILHRWREHFNSLLNNLKPVKLDLIDTIQQRPVQHELDEPPRRDEVVSAVARSASGKAAGADGIPLEVIRAGGVRLIDALFELFDHCWVSSQLPQQFRDATIVTIFKRKGNRRECGNYRGISLLSIPGKIFGKLLLHRLKPIAEDILPESQCGFRPARSAIDMIFTLRQLQEKAIEQQQPLLMLFVDFAKAFDTVTRKGLWRLLSRYGVPPKFISLLRQFHDGMFAQVRSGGEVSDAFPVTHGVKQGCPFVSDLK